MLQKLLASIVVKLLTKWGKAALDALLRWVSALKRAKAQKKAVDELEKKSEVGVSREEQIKAEDDFLNS